MPQALETLCLIQFWSWENSPFPLLALWGNKKWLPSMKVKKLLKILIKKRLLAMRVKKMNNFQNKMSWMGCNWSSLNAQAWAAFGLPRVLGRATATAPARYLYIRGLKILECQLALYFATRPKEHSHMMSAMRGVGWKADYITYRFRECDSDTGESNNSKILRTSCVNGPLW